MKLDTEKIQKNLNTSFLGRKIIYYEKIDSTQDEAKKIAKNNEIINGTYIVTDEQIRGRGTKDRKWYSQKYENICGTFILKPNCNICKIEGFTILIAECLVKAIKHLYDIELQIKYPNDIMCNSKKMAGILTESVTNNEIVQYIFVGIGINVNQTIFHDEVKNIATSLKKVHNKDFEREKIISEFFNIFEKEYIKMIEKG